MATSLLTYVPQRSTVQSVTNTFANFSVGQALSEQEKKLKLLERLQKLRRVVIKIPRVNLTYIAERLDAYFCIGDYYEE